MELDREGFTEQQLNTAWEQPSNEDITEDIISFIRKEVLRSALINRVERTKQALAKLKENHTFLKWNWTGFSVLKRYCCTSRFWTVIYLIQVLS
ncbi:type I restriction-modification enzyme R subunit C-terminal domain-containing protein [Paenibacillus sp. FSL R5-0490]|uniref:type I restriction-modification enzyme R subunit C-terminal domain-containing protein n=1 Tax=Paenibacillus sp. FSL R5-0490 TaxID=1920424 RepID=UPI0030CD6EBB